MRNLSFLVSKFPPHILSGGFYPVSLWGLVTDGMQSDLEATVVQFVDDDIVGVFVADVESGSDRTTVGIDAIVQDVTVS